VWIDDVQVYDAWFYDNERDELLKHIALADVDLEEGRVGDCLHFLDSYWPRFLLAHVPLEHSRMAAKTAEVHSSPRERVKGQGQKPTLWERLRNPFARNPAGSGAPPK
jgi:hypothetical protein